MFKSELNALKKDSGDLLDLMFEIEEKLVSSNLYKEKQLLTMKPKSWSVQKAAEFFEVSEYLVRESQSKVSRWYISNTNIQE